MKIEPRYNSFSADQLFDQIWDRYELYQKLLDQARDKNDPRYIAIWGLLHDLQMVAITVLGSPKPGLHSEVNSWVHQFVHKYSSDNPKTIGISTIEDVGMKMKKTDAL